MLLLLEAVGDADGHRSGEGGIDCRIAILEQVAEVVLGKGRWQLSAHLIILVNLVLHVAALQRVLL